MHEPVGTILWVAIGAMLGGPTRFLVTAQMGRHFGEDFPYGTIIVNVLGCFLIGLFAARAVAHPHLPWAFAVTGFLGSFTTVSSFALQSFGLIEEHGFKRAALNVGLSLGLCLPAVALGYAIGAS